MLHFFICQFMDLSPNCFLVTLNVEMHLSLRVFIPWSLDINQVVGSWGHTVISCKFNLHWLMRLSISSCTLQATYVFSKVSIQIFYSFSLDCSASYFEYIRQYDLKMSILSSPFHLPPPPPFSFFDSLPLSSLWWPRTPSVALKLETLLPCSITPSLSSRCLSDDLEVCKVHALYN